MAEKVKRLGDFVRSARLARKMTARELSHRSGIGFTYISNIERGYINPKRGPVVPSDEVLAALANGLEIDVSELHAQLGRLGALAQGDTLEDDEERRRMELVYQAYKGTKGPIRDAANALLGLQNDLTGDEMSMEDIARITGQDEDDGGTIGKRAK